MKNILVDYCSSILGSWKINTIHLTSLLSELYCVTLDNFLQKSPKISVQQSVQWFTCYNGTSLERRTNKTLAKLIIYNGDFARTAQNLKKSLLSFPTFFRDVYYFGDEISFELVMLQTITVSQTHCSAEKTKKLLTFRFAKVVQILLQSAWK